MKNIPSIKEFFGESKRGLSPDEKEIIKKAYFFAQKAHEGQLRKSGDPYFIHTYETAKTLLSWNLDAETIAAGFLHDVIEDTGTSLETIKNEFGENIAFLVDGITKLSNIKFKGDEVERYAENLRRMFLAMAEDIRVVLIKLADRIHNIKTLQYLPKEKQTRIAKETIEIYAPLGYRLGMGELKGTLEDLCFPYVYPDEYKKILKLVGNRYSETEKYLEIVKPIIIKELRTEGIEAISIHYRAKHLYSLWKKLQAKDVDWNLEKIYDLAAIRIILNTKAECYHVLGIIHRLWRPLPGRIKDYIALPKPNGYQSIHTTIFGPEGRIVEIQIRTREMHEEAENGIAAHWAYSEQGKPKSGVVVHRGKFSWVNQLKDWQDSISVPSDFLEGLKIDVFKKRIFVFTPKGDVVDLPEGATTIDFAYNVHSDIGNHCMGARINGKMVSLNTALKNGDVVDIITAKNKKPSKDWLEFAKTTSAKAKIRLALGVGRRENEK